MTDAWNQPATRDTKTADPRIDLQGAIPPAPTLPGTAPEAGGMAGNPGRLLSRDAAPQPRKSLFRR